MEEYTTAKICAVRQDSVKSSSPASIRVYRLLFLGSVALLRPEVVQSKCSLTYFQLLRIGLFVTYRFSSKSGNSKKLGGIKVMNNPEKESGVLLPLLTPKSSCCSKVPYGVKPGEIQVFVGKMSPCLHISSTRIHSSQTL